MSVREQSHCRVMVNFVSHVVVKGAANLMLFIHCYVYYIVTETPPDTSLVSASDPPPKLDKKVEASLPGKALISNVLNMREA